VISFRVTEYDSKAIRDIARRAAAFAMRHDIQYDFQTAMMDITAVHANGTPLRLDDLLAFPDFDFAHDVFGIRRHLDRETGKLGGHFIPRCARRVPK
jgi:hypothetical protein